VEKCLKYAPLSITKQCVFTLNLVWNSTEYRNKSKFSKRYNVTQPKHDKTTQNTFYQRQTYLSNYQDVK